MWQFIIKGGILMVPLLACSLAAFIIILERIFFYWRANRWEEREIKLIKVYLNQGKLEEAKALTANWNSALGNIVNGMIKNWHNQELLELTAQTIGNEELHKFERGLGILNTIVTASPLLGLMGTVTGIIKSFHALSVMGGNQAMQLSLGISEALYTTAFGLGIAIPSLFFLNYFYSIVDRKAQFLTAESQEIQMIIKKRLGEHNEI